jgi:hypothetical protein
MDKSIKFPAFDTIQEHIPEGVSGATTLHYFEVKKGVSICILQNSLYVAIYAMDITSSFLAECH